MRDILFRGKKFNGEWAYGYYVQADYSWHNYGKHKEWIVCSARANGGWFALQEKHAVIPETVGQYTGLKDKNGKKIFEGDIVHILGNQDVSDLKSVNYNALIAFLDGGFCAIDGTIEEHAIRRYAPARMDFDLEIIGNIHDNKLEDFENGC